MRSTLRLLITILFWAATASASLYTPIPGPLQSTDEVLVDRAGVMYGLQLTTYFSLLGHGHAIADIDGLEAALGGAGTVVNSVTCTGTDKVIAFDTATGNFTCGTDQEGPVGIEVEADPIFAASPAASFDPVDFATAAQGATADTALQAETDPSVAGAISSHASTVQHGTTTTEQTNIALAATALQPESIGDTVAAFDDARFPTADEKANLPALVPHVASIQALRDYTGSATVVYVEGHTTAGDGGGGNFRKDTGTFVDNNGTILVSTGGDGSVRWLRDYSGTVHLRWFGAKGTGLDTDKVSNFEAIKAWWNYGASSKNPLYVDPGVYVTTMFGGEVAGFSALNNVWIYGDETVSEFKLASGENTRLLYDSTQYSAGIRGVRFNGNNPPASWGGAQLNPGTSALVELSGWGNTYDSVVASFSGGTGFLFQSSQQIDLRRIKAYFNVGRGLELSRVIGADLFSPWAEGNDLGGILLRGGSDGGTSRAQAYFSPSIRVYGGYYEGSNPGLELSGICGVKIFGGTDPTNNSAPVFHITKDLTSGAGRQESHSNIIDMTGVYGQTVIDVGNQGNTILLSTGSHYTDPSNAESRKTVIDNDGRNIIRTQIKVWGDLPVSTDTARVNYLDDSNPAAVTIIEGAVSTVSYPTGNLFNPAVSHVAAKNKSCHVEFIPDGVETNGITAYGSAAAVPINSTLYAQVALKVPPSVFLQIQLRDAVNNQYYDWDSQTWAAADTQYNVMPSGQAEFINLSFLTDAVATRKLELRVRINYGYGHADARRCKFYYMGIVNGIDAGLIHRRGAVTVGYGMTDAFFTTAALPAHTEIQKGTTVFDTTTSTRKTATETGWQAVLQEESDPIASGAIAALTPGTIGAESADAAIIKESELSSATNSDSSTTAANSAAVKAVYDLASSKQPLLSISIEQWIAWGGTLPARGDSAICDELHVQYNSVNTYLDSIGINDSNIECGAGWLSLGPTISMSGQSMTLAYGGFAPSAPAGPQTIGMTAQEMVSAYGAIGVLAAGGPVTITLDAQSMTSSYGGLAVSAPAGAATITIASQSMTSAYGTLGVTAVGANSFVDLFTYSDGAVPAPWTSTGSPSISSSKLLFNAIGEAVRTPTAMVRGFAVEIDLQMPLATGEDDWTSTEIGVGSSSTHGATGSYGLAFSNEIDIELTPFGMALILKNGTIVASQAITQSSANRVIRFELHDNGDLIGKIGGTTVITYNDATYTDFSYLFLTDTSSITPTTLINNVLVEALP